MKNLITQIHYLLLFSFTIIAGAAKAQYWQPVAGQISNVRFTGIAANVSSTTVIVTTFKNGIYRSIDSGNTWQQVFVSQDTIFSLADMDGKHLCAGGKGFTYTSSDSGITWTTHTFPFPVAVARLAFHPSGALIAGTGSKWDIAAGNLGKGVWLSLDTGKTWSAINTGITKQNPLIEALAVTSGGTILAGIYDNNTGLSGKYGILKLDSLSGTWQRVSITVNAPFNQTYSDQNLRVESVFNINVIDEQVVASIAGAYINFGYAFSIQKSVQDIDNASSPWKVKWVQDSLPSSGSFYEHLTNLFKESDDTIWASVSVSSNEINNALFTGSLSNDMPWDLNIDSITEQTGRFLFAEAANGRLYSLSYFTGNQIFVRANTITPVSLNESDDKQHRSLQVFPNPANEYVVMKFELDEQHATEFYLFDINGTRIKSIAQETIDSGSRTVCFNTKDLCAGVYIIRGKIGGNDVCRKLIITH